LDAAAVLPIVGVVSGMSLPFLLPSLSFMGPSIEVGEEVTDPPSLPPSGVFDPFMGPYIELEKRNMEEMLEKALADDQVDRYGRREGGIV